VHKLLVIGERSGAYRAKIAKDVAQAASLIEPRRPPKFPQSWPPENPPVR
jgi:hypothetical protein